jgi:hypothetical protein
LRVFSLRLGSDRCIAGLEFTLLDNKIGPD